ncbi:polycomb protein Pcl-like isoform X2 [Anopheles albimanus]|nr:polycomb protein Pcl-like isoform X2 [Anopheles albimanus]
METKDEIAPITCKQEDLLNDIDMDMEEQFHKQQIELLSDNSHISPIPQPLITNEATPITMEIENICEDMDQQRIILSHALSLSPSVLKQRPDNKPVEYRINQDVLVKHADGRLYLGTVIGISGELCQVQYDDSTVQWINKDALNKLDSEDAEIKDTICTICNQHKSAERTRNCCICLRGFHASCLPFDERLIVIQSEPWFAGWHCKECHEKDTLKQRMSDCSEEIDSLNERIQIPCRTPIWPEGLEPLTERSQLPYHFERLNWDSLHRVNTAGQYCYCGTYGLWTREMIMCRRCKQWFHSRCIRSLQFPVFLGDPFYFFLCSICNHGHEFVRRVEISWRDLLHLVLYNLIMRNRKRFFSVEKAIAPYMEENLRTLQLPDNILRLTVHNRQKIIIKTLRSHKDSFKQLKKIEGNTVRRFWTLRYSLPPELELSDVPQDNIITEQSLKDLGLNDRSVRFLPRGWIERSLVNDVECRELMQGLKYAADSPSPNDFVRSSDTDSSQESEFSSSSPTPDLGQDMEGAANDVKKRRNKKSNPLLRQKTRGRKGTLLGRNGNQTASQKNLPVQLPSLDELIPPLDNFKGKNNPFHPMFGQKNIHVASPPMSDVAKLCGSCSLPLPSGAKRRKCYRQPIEYHLHHDVKKEEKRKPDGAFNLITSYTPIKPNKVSSTIGNSQTTALDTQLTLPLHKHMLRERTTKINYSLKRTYKRRESLVGVDGVTTQSIQPLKRRQSLCINNTTIAESQESKKIKRRMSVCADVLRNNNGSIESHLSAILTNAGPKAERSANNIPINEIDYSLTRNNKRCWSTVFEDDTTCNIDTGDAQLSKKRRQSVCEATKNNKTAESSNSDKYKRRMSVCDEMLIRNNDTNASQVLILTQGKAKAERSHTSKYNPRIRGKRTFPNGEVQLLIRQSMA